MPTWEDFHNEGFGPLLPLTSGQQVQLVSGIMPSSEAHFLDFEQHGTALPSSYPYPYTDTPEKLAFVSGQTRDQFPDQFSSGWWDASGIFKTYPDALTVPTDLVDSGRESGIFHFNELLSQFSNAAEKKAQQIDDFTIFNPYIHHERLPTTLEQKNRKPVEIPYISTYNLQIDFYPYNSGIWTGYGSIPISNFLP